MACVCMFIMLNLISPMLDVFFLCCVLINIALITIIISSNSSKSVAPLVTPAIVVTSNLLDSASVQLLWEKHLNNKLQFNFHD